MYLHVTPPIIDSKNSSSAIKQYVLSKPSYLDIRLSTEACDMRCEQRECLK